MQKSRRPGVYFGAAGLLGFVIVQLLLSAGVLDTYWRDVIFSAATLVMLALGLNLIYGFSGQFSFAPYAFYAIGASASISVSFRWENGDTAALLVVCGSLLTLACYAPLRALLKRFYGITALTRFTLYLLATLLAFWVARQGLLPLAGPLFKGVLSMLPAFLAQQLLFLLTLLGGGLLSGIVSYLFAIATLELRCEHFAVATLGFTIVVKVLLENRVLDFFFSVLPSLEGAEGVPPWATWPWVCAAFFAVLWVMRNLLHSSSGRAIAALREDAHAAELLGIDVARLKVMVFVIGAVFAGLAGGLRAHSSLALPPGSFNLSATFELLLIVALGGLGSMTGTIVTGFVWVILFDGLLPQFLPLGFESWRLVLSPLVLMLLLWWRPGGLLGGYELPFLRQDPPAPGGHEPGPLAAEANL